MKREKQYEQLQLIHKTLLTTALQLHILLKSSEQEDKRHSYIFLGSTKGGVPFVGIRIEELTHRLVWFASSGDFRLYWPCGGFQPQQERKTFKTQKALLSTMCDEAAEPLMLRLEHYQKLMAEGMLFPGVDRLMAEQANWRTA